MAAFDDKHLSGYKRALVSLEGGEGEMLKFLSLDDNAGYAEFMVQLEECIDDEISTLMPMIDEIDNEEDLNYLKQQLSSLLLKKKVISSKLRTEEEVELQEERKRNLIFLNDGNGRPLIERDAKDISKDYQESLGYLIEQLRNFDIAFNKFSSAKLRKLVNNASLKDIFEAKEFKVRLFFTHLDKDTFLILMASYKNQDNPGLLRETLSSRTTACRREIAKIKEKLKNPVTKKELTDIHNAIADELISMYKGVERGKSYE